MTTRRRCRHGATRASRRPDLGQGQRPQLETSPAGDPPAHCMSATRRGGGPFLRNIEISTCCQGMTVRRLEAGHSSRSSPSPASKRDPRYGFWRSWRRSRAGTELAFLLVQVHADVAEPGTARRHAAPPPGEQDEEELGRRRRKSTFPNTCRIKSSTAGKPVRSWAAWSSGGSRSAVQVLCTDAAALGPSAPRVPWGGARGDRWLPAWATRRSP